MRSVGLAGVAVLFWAALCSAQGTNVNAVRGRISERMVVGSTTLGDVLRIVGAGTVSSGTGTINPAVIDADGDVLEDTFTTVTTGGVHTWSSAGTFNSTLAILGAATLSGTLSVTGNISGSTGTLLATSPLQITTAAPFLRLIESGAGTDETVTELLADADTISLDLVADALGTRNTLFKSQRTGLVPGDWRWGTLLANVRPETNGNTSLGSQSKKYLTLHAWELWVDTLVARNTIATIGGRILVAPTSELTVDVATGDTCILVKHNAFRANDTLLLQKDGKFEKMLLGSNPIDCSVSGNCGVLANHYAYCSITRNRDGTGANAWLAGDAVVGEGNVGDGFIDIFADRSASSEGYFGQVVSDGPVAYWRMSEAPSGQTVDVMGNAPNAVEAGTPSAGLGTLAGVLGTTTSDPVFDNRGATGYLTVANVAALQITNDLTIEWWMYRQSATPATSDIISRGGTKEYSITVDTNGAMIFCHGNVSTFECETTANGFVPTGGADYTHYAVVRDATSSPKRVLFYKDGVLAETHTYTQIVTNSVTTTLHIGHNPDVAGRFLDGDIDEVSIYNYQVSADRIALHFAARKNNSISKFTIGPTLCGNVRTGTGAFDVAERWCMGNLAGTYGYATSVAPVYGFASGNPSATWVSVDATNGFRVMNGSTEKLKADTSGNLALTGDLTIGTSGVFRSAAATTLTSGTGLYMAGGTTPTFRVGIPSGNELKWDGTDLMVKSANLSISPTGLSIDAAAAIGFDTARAYGFALGGGITAGMGGFISGGTFPQIDLRITRNGGSTVTILSENTAGGDSSVTLSSQNGATPSRLFLSAADLFINGTQGHSGTCTVLPTVVDGIITSC